MKCTIEHTLKDGETMNNFINKFRGDEWRDVVWEFQQELRKVYKYSQDDKEIEIAEKFRDILFELLNDAGLSSEP